MLGNLPAFARDPLEFLAGLRSRGDVVHWSLGPRRNVFVSTPDLINDMMTRMETDFHRDGFGWAFRQVIGNGLTISSGPQWKRKRAAVQPAVHPKQVRWFGPDIAACAAELSWERGQTVDVLREMTALTRRITVRTLFGSQSVGQEESIGAAMAEAQHGIGMEFRGITWFLPDWVRTPGRARLRSAVSVLDREIERLIAVHRAEERSDVLSRLIAARDEAGAPLSEAELRDEAIALYIGGHETTSATLTWLWYLLSSAPEARAVLDAELSAVIGDRLPVYEDFNQLDWTRQLVKEALRLYPPIWLTPSIASHDTALAGEVPVPKGTTVWTSQWATHRDPRWFPSPDSFLPQRWGPHGDGNSQAWFPFGKGPRVCVGARFALVVTTLVLATLAQKFRLSVRNEARPVPHLTLQPDRPIYAVVS